MDQARTMELLRLLLKTHPIDPSRVYIAGRFRAGSAALEMASREPGVFAAVLAEQPRLYPDAPAKLVKTPICVLVRADATDTDKSVVAALRDAGNTRVEFVHAASNRVGRENSAAYDWLFQQALH